MKTTWLILGVLFGLAIAPHAQTNPPAIIFSKLLSPTNSVLMTNAEFRCIAGNKLFFKNDAGYQSFHAADRNTNVLNALNTTAEKLESKQQAMNAADQKFKARTAALAAEQKRAQWLQAQQQAALLKKQQAELEKELKDQAARTVIVVPAYQEPGLNQNQREGAYSP